MERLTILVNNSGTEGMLETQLEVREEATIPIFIQCALLAVGFRRIISGLDLGEPLGGSGHTELMARLVAILADMLISTSCS